MIRALGLTIAMLGVSLLAVGCNRVQAEMAAARAQFLLAEEPADAQGVLDLRDAGTTGDVVVVGRVGGVSQPWSKGQALFIISDPTAFGDDEHVCTDDGCPFCANKKQAENEAIAVVQFVDAQGFSHPQRLLCQAEAIVCAPGDKPRSPDGCENPCRRRREVGPRELLCPGLVNPGSPPLTPMPPDPRERGLGLGGSLPIADSQ